MKDLRLKGFNEHYTFTVHDNMKGKEVMFSDGFEDIYMPYDNIDELVCWLTWLQQEWSQRDMI